MTTPKLHLHDPDDACIDVDCPWCELTADSTDETAHGYTLSAWLDAAGRDLGESNWDLRAAWRAGEDPSNYVSDECDKKSSYHASGACSCEGE